MAKKKIILFIVEGPSDETSLSTVLSRIFSSSSVKFQVIHGDIYCHHQYKLIAGRAFGLEYGISVISCTEISAHFGNGTVLADLNDGVIITGQGIQYFAMDAGIVILRSYKFTHGYNRLGFRRSLRCITVTGTSC